MFERTNRVVCPQGRAVMTTACTPLSVGGKAVQVVLPLHRAVHCVLWAGDLPGLRHAVQCTRGTGNDVVQRTGRGADAPTAHKERRGADTLAAHRQTHPYTHTDTKHTVQVGAAGGDEIYCRNVQQK
jgi:hypothetical protein